MNFFTLSQFIALIACCIGGGMGGLALSHPKVGLRHLGFSAEHEQGRPAHHTSSIRGLGGMLLITHATAAGMIGFRPETGNVFLLCLALAWFGTATGRIVSVVAESGDKGSDRWNPIILELLMGLALASPLWAQVPPVSGLVT
jgi:hypothetical protein